MHTHKHTHTLVIAACCNYMLQLAAQLNTARCCSPIRNQVGEQHFNFGFRFVLPASPSLILQSTTRMSPPPLASWAGGGQGMGGEGGTGGAGQGCGLVGEAGWLAVAVNHKRAHNSSFQLEALSRSPLSSVSPSICLSVSVSYRSCFRSCIVVGASEDDSRPTFATGDSISASESSCTLISSSESDDELSTVTVAPAPAAVAHSPA